MLGCRSFAMNHNNGDGLIWIKRKHYFRPEFNPHFFADYFRESLVLTRFAEL
jgi:hypothetical protein